MRTWGSFPGEIRTGRPDSMNIACPTMYVKENRPPIFRPRFSVRSSGEDPRRIRSPGGKAMPDTKQADAEGTAEEIPDAEVVPDAPEATPAAEADALAEPEAASAELIPVPPSASGMVLAAQSP